VKTGGRLLVGHARHFTLQLPESHLMGRLLERILERLERLICHRGDGEDGLAEAMIYFETLGVLGSAPRNRRIHSQSNREDGLIGVE
jgi:hypothetical protein